MKPIITVIILVLTAIMLSGEPVVSSYKMDGKTYDVMAARDGSLYVSVYGQDVFARNPFMSIPPECTEGVITGIKDMGKKYMEWSKTAKANNVESYVGLIEGVTINAGFGWEYGGKLHFSGLYKPETINAYFMVIDYQPSLILQIKEQTSMTNKYVTWDPKVIMGFQSIDEINAFINALDPMHVRRKYDEIDKKNDMFK